MSAKRRQQIAKPSGDAGTTPRTLAAIELGTTSVRMVIAQTNEAGDVKHLGSLQQPVTLGKDSFTKGYIELETTEKCVEVLRSFDRALQEYQIGDTSNVRAVATSAVREASNRQAFLDRIYIATGMQVDELDEAEVSRLTYLALRPLLKNRHVKAAQDTLAVEVGGGSTEVLQLRQGKVAHAHSFRLGSLRLREMLEEFRRPVTHAREILQTHVDRDVRRIVDTLELPSAPCLLALGGDARLAASVITDSDPHGGVTSVSVKEFAKLTNKVMGMSVDDIFRIYHTSYPDAETLGPALLVYSRLAHHLGLKEIRVGQPSLRDGLVLSMAGHGWWTNEFAAQVLGSAHDLARKFGADMQHGENVAQFLRQLFQALQDDHCLDPHFELILSVAAILHDVGLYISTRSHHKHSMYIIENTDIFGLGTRDQLLTALVARYHRKALPRPTHDGYATLDRVNRVAVAKLAAILRVADALDRQHRGYRRRPAISVEPDQLVITFSTAGDLTLERHALEAKGLLFKQVYGKNVVLLNPRRTDLT